MQDLTQIEKVFDWAFSSPYKGQIASLNEECERINEEIEGFKGLIESLSKETDDIQSF